MGEFLGRACVRVSAVGRKRRTCEGEKVGGNSGVGVNTKKVDVHQPLCLVRSMCASSKDVRKSARGVHGSCKALRGPRDANHDVQLRLLHCYTWCGS